MALGALRPDGREYIATGTPPASVGKRDANPQVGCLATDSGVGYTWTGNSQANRLTPWSNDPVSDPPAEVIYVRDEETGHFWSRPHARWVVLPMFDTVPVTHAIPLIVTAWPQN